MVYFDSVVRQGSGLRVRRIWLARVAMLTALTLAGCEQASTTEAEADDLGFRGIATYNGLDLGNGLAFSNGLSLRNGLALSNGLAYSNGLTLSNGLAYSNGLDPNIGYMSTEAGRKFVKYLVECALPTGDSLTKGEFKFDGKVGLAPEWKYGNCGTDCQEWLSACLLARTNEFGVTVKIDMRAGHQAIGTAPGDPSFTEQEGAFFGNLFASPPVAYACMGKSWANAQHVKRDCTTGTPGCQIKNVDYLSCFWRCTMSRNGVMLECPNSRLDGAPLSRRYNAVITTYLKPWWMP